MQGFETLAKRYAMAVFSLASEANAVDAVGADLHAIAAGIGSDDDVRRFFVSPVIDAGVKTRVMTAAFERTTGEIAFNTLLLLVRKRREALLDPLVRAYDQLVLAAAGREELEIVSARPLGDADLARMVDRLQSRYGKKFRVRASVDPTLLGGVRIAMGDRLIDASLSGRIDDLARDLLATTV